MTNPTPTSPPPAAPKKSNTVRNVVLVAVLAVALIAAAYNAISQWQSTRTPKYSVGGPGEIKFLDHARSNTPLAGADAGSLEFVDATGKPVDLKQYRGKKNVVLVVTRGHTSGGPASFYIGNVCIYCSTQTSRLVANYDAIRKHEAEVVVVYPVLKASDAPQLKAFGDAVTQSGKLAAPPPFPLVVDPELKAVDRLGIRDDLAKPATYILDFEGQVRFAYVGKSIADRPSVQSILEQLELIAAEAKPSGT